MAIPSLPAMPAPHPFPDDASFSATPFASQLSFATAHAAEADATNWRAVETPIATHAPASQTSETAAPQAATLQSILPLLVQPTILTAPKPTLPRAAARPMATGIPARAAAKQ